MADSRDKPELETLSYLPPSYHQYWLKSHKGVKGKNTPVIKPETKVNKTEIWEPPDPPNKNIMIIEEIEGLMSQVNEKLCKLSRSTFNLSDGKSLSAGRAIEEIDLFQKTTLFDLRKTFE